MENEGHLNASKKVNVLWQIPFIQPFHALFFCIGKDDIVAKFTLYVILIDRL